MYNTTTKFGEAIRGDTRSFLAKIISNGKEAEDVIVNLQKYSKSTSGDSIPIGGAISSYVTMDLWNPNFTVKDAEVSVEIGLQLDDAVEWVELGTFTCEKPTTSSDGLINVTAYDCISTKMSGTYLSDLEYPTDSINVLKELEKKTGVKIDTSGLEKGVLLNKVESMSESDIDEDGNEVTNVTYTNPLDGYTYREVLGYIAMLHCKYAVADVDGTVVFKWFKDVNDYTITGDEYFDDFEDSELEFLVGAISCSTLSQTFESGNGDVNVWLENPIMTQERLDYIYSVLKTLKFVPCHFSFYGDIRLELFDTVKVEKADGTVYNVPIMDVTQDFDGGLKTEIQSFGAGIQEGDGTSGNLLEKVDRFYYELLTVKEIVGKKASFDNLYALNGEFSSLKADNGEFKNLVAENFSAVNANIENLTAKSITTDNLYVKVAEFGYLTAEKADIDYAKIDFSNVGTQVVSSSMIIDGAVTNEKVGNLSANKITSGTIDASKIYVTNLNADNLTVGTINGQRIGDKSIDLNKLAKEVPTKEYLDSVQENLQGQIDGAIETFTKTEIPTLQNEPASLWTDNATKNKHVGDICYVVNPTSSADGYCYRFANLGTEIDPNYEWVLIKDSDVTKTLQDIIDIYGEITGIKKFDTEISAWKVNTDSELSSIKAKTTKLETDIGNRVEVSVFNTLKQTVDENSGSITSLSTTVKNKADGSTVTELANTVNNIKQTADSNSLSISSMKTDIKNKADGSTVETLSKQVSTIDQGLSSVRISVSEETTNRQNDTKRLEGLLEVKVNTKDLISEINASADVINLTGDRIIIDSENFKVAKDGTITAKNGNFTGTITGSSGEFTKDFKVNIQGIDMNTFLMAISHDEDAGISHLEISCVGDNGISSITMDNTSVDMSSTTAVFISAEKGVSVSSLFGGITINTRSAKIVADDDGVAITGGLRVDGTQVSLNGHTHNSLYNASLNETIAFIKDGDYGYFRPNTASLVYCGSSARPWYKVYTEQLEVLANRPTMQPVYDNTVSYETNCYISSAGLLSRTTKTSSRTIKHDIKAIADNDIAPERLYDVSIYQFKYDDGILTDKTDSRYAKLLPGFIIEELAEQYPIAVDRPSDNVKEWSWNAQYLIPPMLKLIQDQHEVDEQLEKKLAEQEARIEQLESQVQQLMIQMEA